MNILPFLQLSIKMVYVYRPNVYHACDRALSGAFAGRESKYKKAFLLYVLDLYVGRL